MQSQPNAEFFTPSGAEGKRLAWLGQAGLAPTVVFLGGYRSDMRGTKAERLSATCAKAGLGLLRFDYRGHGESSGTFTDLTISDWLNDADDIVSAKTAGPLLLVGSSMGGWIALAAVILLGARHGRYKNDGRITAHPPSSIPFLALGSWILIVGWFGFNVMSAQRLDAISGLVAINSLMAMVGGTIAAKVAGKDDPGFLHNGPLAGLVAICAGSDVVHPLGALFIGISAGVIFVKLFTYTQNKLKVDDVLGVWPLHGVCGAFGGLAVGIFGQQWLGGMGGVSLISQLVGTVLAIIVALAGGFLVYGLLKVWIGIRLTREEEFTGADLSIHRISANSEENIF